MRENSGVFSERADSKKVSQGDLEFAAAWLDATLQALPQAVALFGADHRLLKWSAQFEKLGGLRPGCLRFGLPLDTLLRTLPISQEGDPFEVLRSGSGLPPVLRVSRSDGHLLEIRTAPGPRNGVLLLLADLTESKSKTRHESHLIEVLNTTPAALLVLDADDRIVLWNEKFLELNRAAELEVGLPFRELLWRYVRLGDLWRIESEASAAVESRMEIHLNYAGPFEEWVSTETALQTSEHRTSDGGCIIMHVDVSERKRAERDLMHMNKRLEEQAAELERANAAKSRFLANMSHEFRTPLNAVIGFAELLREEGPEVSPEHASRDLEKIAAAGRHLLALMNDILDLSKVEAGKMEITTDVVDLKVLIQEIEATVEPLIRKNSNRLEIVYRTDALTLRSDATRVRQVLYNLLSNAAKFTSNGRVALEVSDGLEAGERFVTLLVSDSGIGITAEQLQRLFQPFTQADISTQRIYGGTGLGLALSRRFCRLLGGDLTVESVWGEGSRFRARLKDSRPI